MGFSRFKLARMDTSEETKISRRKFLKTSGGLALGAGVLALGTATYANQIEPNWIEISCHEIPLPHLPRAFDGFKIAQISDIHLENGGMEDEFPAICDLVSAQKPDVVVITGDFLSTFSRALQKPLTAGLQRLKAPDGIWCVMGNHDVIGGELRRQIIHKSLGESGGRELFNAVHVFERDGARLHLAGVDDLWLGRPDVDKVAAQIPDGEAAILLGHEPDYAAQISQLGKFGLMLSGHSHGGQIVIPGFKMRLPDYATRFPRGLYQSGALAHYTNRGLGTVGIPMRFGSRPEIAIFTLRA